MKKKTRITILMSVGIAAVCLLYFWHDVAEAARLGGSKSFGSRPSYQRSAPAPTPTSTSPQVSPSQPAQQRPIAGPTPSPMGRWGGMLGGLLMGGLIGSLLFGGAHAYGGPGMLDFVILGGGLFLLYRFIRARRMGTESLSADLYSKPSEIQAANTPLPVRFANVDHILVAELLLRWPVETSPAAVAAGIVSVSVRIIFGFYPARKASRLDPIEALRYK